MVPSMLTWEPGRGYVGYERKGQGKDKSGLGTEGIKSSVWCIGRLVCGLVICYYIKTMTLRFSRLKQQPCVALCLCGSEIPTWSGRGISA